MSKYNNSKIYKLVDLTTNKIFIGATCSKLSCRLAIFKNCYKQYKLGKYTYIKAFELLKNDSCRIDLLENYSCETKEELNAKLGEYVSKLDCINKDSITPKIMVKVVKTKEEKSPKEIADKLLCTSEEMLPKLPKLPKLVKAVKAST